MMELFRVDPSLLLLCDSKDSRWWSYWGPSLLLLCDSKDSKWWSYSDPSLLLLCDSKDSRCKKMISLSGTPILLTCLTVRVSWWISTFLAVWVSWRIDWSHCLCLSYRLTQCLSYRLTHQRGDQRTLNYLVENCLECCGQLPSFAPLLVWFSLVLKSVGLITFSALLVIIITVHLFCPVFCASLMNGIIRKPGSWNVEQPL